MKKILVVDDDAGVRHLIRRLLKREGYEVIEGSDRQDIFELIRTEHPALVLMDVHMPRLDGIEALRKIIKNDPGVAVIMVSGDDNLGLARQAMEKGACDYITKPLDLRSLQMSVKAYMPLVS